MLNNLEERDDNVYRIIFEAEPIPNTIRQAGIGGVNRYKELIEGNLERKDIIIDNYAKIDELKRKLYIQTKSYTYTAVDLLFKSTKFSKVKFVRLAAHLNEIDNAFKICKIIKKKGYKVAVNLMQISEQSEKSIVEDNIREKKE